MLSHWFSESEISPGAVIEMEKSWTVVRACEEHISQYSKDQGSPGHPPASDVTFRLICEQTDGNIKSHIRIYKQIPAAGTEAEPAAVRAKQAKPCEPDELIALRALTNKRSRFTPRLLDSKNTTQDDSGFVPGGFLVYVAWEVVAGEQLVQFRASPLTQGIVISARATSGKQAVQRMYVDAAAAFNKRSHGVGATASSYAVVRVVLVCYGDGTLGIHLCDQGLHISAGYSVHSCASTEQTPTWTLAGQSATKLGEATGFADECAPSMLSSKQDDGPTSGCHWRTQRFRSRMWWRASVENWQGLSAAGTAAIQHQGA
ncbi:similar to An08g09690 [Aspergillus niger]|uniref:Similar to An08g09690 n=1 Tax=Aspergillus niger TaxID=5061 RepID=A0A117E0R9_ASPNG|nr:similar to An08g09690 [Aspergillus niger]